MMQAFFGLGVLLICSYHVGFSSATECVPQVADCYFGVDASGSVTYQTFLNAKTYLKSVVEKLVLGVDKQWIKIHTFGTSVSDDYGWITDVNKAKEVIDNLRYHNSTTAIHKVCTHGNDQLMRYSRDVLTTPKLFFLISDGKPTKLNAAQEAIESLEANGILIITQAYTSDSKTDRLRDWAYSDDYAIDMEINSGWSQASYEGSEAICKGSNNKLTAT